MDSTDRTVRVVIINYQTPDLLRQAVQSFRDVYPDVLLELVDNGSEDDSRAEIERLVGAHPASTVSTVHAENLYHGPAMHHAMVGADEPYVFFLDSDTITHRGGFLEDMCDILDNKPDIYVVGQVAYADKRGFASSAGTPVPVSAYMMIRRSMYLELPPFIHHGLPVLANCQEAARKGWEIEQYRIQDYVEHLGRGTAERYGYGLGWRSRVEYILKRLGL